MSRVKCAATSRDSEVTADALKLELEEAWNMYENLLFAGGKSNNVSPEPMAMMT